MSTFSLYIGSVLASAVLCPSLPYCYISAGFAQQIEGYPSLQSEQTVSVPSTAGCTSFVVAFAYVREVLPVDVVLGASAQQHLGELHIQHTTLSPALVTGLYSYVVCVQRYAPFVSSEPVMRSAGTPEFIVGSSHSSKSVSHRRPSQTSPDILFDMLFGSRSHGLRTSLFTSGLHELQDSMYLHGLSGRGLPYRQCQEMYLAHIFHGHCVQFDSDFESHDFLGSRDRTGCRHFAEKFRNPDEMRTYATQMLVSGSTKNGAVDNMAVVASALNISHTWTGSRYNKRQLEKKILAHANIGLRPPAEQNRDMFEGFEAKKKTDLLAILDLHGLREGQGGNVKASFSTEEIKRVIMAHVCSGECSFILDEHCSPDKFDLYGKAETRIRVLRKLCSVLTRVPMLRLYREVGLESPEDTSIDSLREVLASYIDREESEISDLSSSLKEDEKARIWPQVPSAELKDKIYRLFKEQISSQSLQRRTCFSCAEDMFEKESHLLQFDSLDISKLYAPHVRMSKDENGPVQSDWYTSQNSCPWSRNYPPHFPREAIVCLDGYIASEIDHGKVHLCKECHTALKSRRTPAISLANHHWLGAVPSVLQDLTVVEEATIALCRSKSCIVQMKEEGLSKNIPNSQRGMKGHVVIFPQDVTGVAKVLPPNVDDVKTSLCVLFIGSQKPSKEWLREKAKPLLVRREKIRAALEWLKLNNPLYASIEIHQGNLEQFPADDILDVHLEHVEESDSQSNLTGNYDNITREPPLEEQAAADVFENIVISNVDDNANSARLKAAAMKHFKTPGKRHLQISHDPNPITEFFSPNLLPSIYPSLFPLGIGGCEDNNRSEAISLKKHVKHLFSLNDRRFQEHYSFMFTVFSVLQKREIMLHTHLRVKSNKFPAIAQTFDNITPEAILSVAERMEAGDFSMPKDPIERKVMALMKEVNLVNQHVSGSSAQKAKMRNEIRSLLVSHGLPSFYITINPADIYNPLVKFLAGSEINLDDLTTESIPQYVPQSILIARNPKIAAQFFNIYMKAFISAVLGVDNDKLANSGGILGRVKSYYGCVEAQGRGTLHCHMVIWLENSLNVNEIRDRVVANDTDFQDRLIAFLDDAISNEIPDDVIADDVASSLHHPCSVYGEREAYGPDSVRNVRYQKDIHNLAKKCQAHRHSATCYKYWKGPSETKECRFRLDEHKKEEYTYLDPPTGEIHLRCLDGMVANFNETMLRCIRSNMDIQFMGTGASAKAVIYYITDYISKSQLKAHVAYSTLELALKKLQETDNPNDDDQTVRAKRLLQKCVFTMISRQELSGQQVSSYLMDYEDHFTNQKFRNLYWIPFEKLVDDIYPLENPTMPKDTADASNDFQEDIRISSNDDGSLVGHANQSADYQLRGNGLRSACLWDYCASINKKKVARDKINSNEPSQKYKQYNFDGDHSESNSHLQVQLPNIDSFIPVPIGPALPRRDRNDQYERYCRLMLILFLPWKYPEDLKTSDESWREAFERRQIEFAERHTRIMTNIYLMHECKDHRDADYEERAKARQLSKNRERRENDDDNDVTQHDSEVLLTLLNSIDNCESDKVIASLQMAEDCQEIAQEMGIFNRCFDEAIACQGNENLETDGANNAQQEYVWRNMYEQNKAAWKNGDECHTNLNASEGTPLAAIDSHMDVTTTDIDVHNESSTREQSFPMDVETPTIEGVAARHNLNREQKRAFKIVASHCIDGSNDQLKLYIGGSGGTGKSRVITAIKDYFALTNQGSRLRLAAYTGIAANNIHGVTLHAALNLSANGKRSATSLEQLKAMWRGIDYLLIDEISMIGCRFLTRIHKALCEAKESELPFGGVNIITAGDFAQLPPVGDTKLYAPLNKFKGKTIDGQNILFGQILWNSFRDVVMLTEPMRQSGPDNLEYVNLLARLKTGNCLARDYQLLLDYQLQKRPTNWSDPSWDNAPTIVGTNELKDYLNICGVTALAKKRGESLTYYFAKYKEKGTIIKDSRVLDHLNTLHTGHTNSRMGALPLCIGMPVMLTQNFDVSNGVVNGCTGILKSINYQLNERGERQATSCIVRSDSYTGPTMLNLIRGEFAVLAEEVDISFIHPYSKNRAKLKMTQLPLVPAFSLTVHKAQGQTYDRVIVDLNSTFTCESAYVMLSRCTTLEGLRVLKHFSEKKIQNHQGQNSRDLFKRLNALRIKTILKHGDDNETSFAREYWENRIELSPDLLHEYDSNSPSIGDLSLETESLIRQLDTSSFDPEIEHLSFLGQSPPLNVKRTLERLDIGALKKKRKIG
ncbi:hypothetical protein D9613_005788 [Agrocybe pediades]|uniref:ATP-dependent DNA helicase n=1 Tax=Agrocybe pediades TaxID=84607 RepID=A0A8H4VP79_9AGAR|nr:hypothetical protein D9613_005788 [Agrocybe pediades]